MERTDDELAAKSFPELVNTITVKLQEIECGEIKGDFRKADERGIVKGLSIGRKLNPGARIYSKEHFPKYRSLLDMHNILPGRSRTRMEG